LAKTRDFGIMIVEAVEAVSTASVRYVGVRLEPNRKETLARQE